MYTPVSSKENDIHSYACGCLFHRVLSKKEGFKRETMANMISISVGVAITAHGEAKFNSWGSKLRLCFSSKYLFSSSFGTNSLCAFARWKDITFDNECCRSGKRLVDDQFFLV
ncbi:hypothetical protein L6164_013389 [Bauhinia variegata]|uniref:Uncharacterized protein n=1 Tax=Bauhinia variegata TaxID=167791 RepID=A0ACB9NES5_BAUVA|nr:hypothetical protein L6164_013389 [Bauhinia variegata]